VACPLNFSADTLKPPQLLFFCTLTIPVRRGSRVPTPPWQTHCQCHSVALPFVLSPRLNFPRHGCWNKGWRFDPPPGNFFSSRIFCPPENEFARAQKNNHNKTRTCLSKSSIEVSPTAGASRPALSRKPSELGFFPRLNFFFSRVWFCTSVPRHWFCWSPLFLCQAISHRSVKL